MDEFFPSPTSPTLKPLDCRDPTPIHSFANEYSFERRPLSETLVPQDTNQDTWDWLPSSKDPNFKRKIQKLRASSQMSQGRSPRASEETKSTKNIVKNYGNAIASFATSKLAIPYLTEFLKNDALTPTQFQEYILNQKRSLCNIYNLRTILQENESDSAETRIKKRTFRKIAEVFIKYFSVNWIFNSRLKHREAHLKFRGKMLRRVQRPDLFTYMNEKV